MSQPHVSPPTDLEVADARRRLTSARIRQAGHEPFHVSAQLGWAAATTGSSTLGALRAVEEGAPWVSSLLAVGVVLSWVGWAHARRSGRLEPFLPAPRAVLMNALRPEDRRSLTSVTSGRTRPATAAEHDLALLVLEERCRADRTGWPGYVGFAVASLGSVLSEREPWVSASGVLVVVVAGVVVLLGARRSRRALGTLTESSVSSSAGGRA